MNTYAVVPGTDQVSMLTGIPVNIPVLLLSHSLLPVPGTPLDSIYEKIAFLLMATQSCGFILNVMFEH